MKSVLTVVNTITKTPVKGAGTLYPAEMLVLAEAFVAPEHLRTKTECAIYRPTHRGDFVLATSFEGCQKKADQKVAPVSN